MLKNFIKIAIRNLVRQKYYTIINIGGLALGIAASVLIYLWISHEAGFDTYHKNYQNIYRLTTDARLGGQVFKVCLVPSALAEEYKNTCPEVIKTARISRHFSQVFKYKDNSFKEKKVILADTGFFQLFHFDFLEGDPNKPFEDRESIILTESLARKYFGDESAMGKVLRIDEQNAVMVSAVIRDVPSNTHLQFDAAMYFNIDDDWGNFNWMTYVLFRDGFSENKVKTSLQNISDNTIIPQMTRFMGTSVDQFREAGNYLYLYIQPIKSVHLNSEYYGELEPGGNKTYVTFFSIIALFILIIAGINYMNLSIAFYDTRVTEVGIRKANGATRGILIRQFLIESVLISLSAFLTGLIIIEVTLPLFTHFLDIEINHHLLESRYFIFLLMLVMLGLGLIFGIFPALYLSRFKTTSMLKNVLKPAGTGSIGTRSALVIIQFAITIRCHPDKKAGGFHA
jgi:putative ABC transport system permease protein